MKVLLLKFSFCTSWPNTLFDIQVDVLSSFLRWLLQWYLPRQRRKQVCARNMFHKRLQTVGCHSSCVFTFIAWFVISCRTFVLVGKRALEEAVAAPPTKKTKAEKKVVPPPKKVESSSEEESDSEEEVCIMVDSLCRVMMTNLFLSSIHVCACWLIKFC